MPNTPTQQPLVVSLYGDANPYIDVPLVQLEQVRTALKSKKIPHWVDEEAISLDGKPETIVINLGRGVNSELVQKLLDSIR